ncbi:MAG: HNH endonuclease [Prevotella sp.]|nr:HNH endonuclease [Prevotella sp.]
MASKICFICGNPLTESNRSKEHILLNAAGGKLKSYDIMCATCNTRMGSKPDDALALQLRSIANHLGVKRDNGRTPNIPVVGTDGKKYEIQDGGKPTLGEATIEFNPATGVMRIETGAIGQARTELWKFKKEHPEYDIDVRRST